MANTFFKFKQFTIHQEKCAMKVCTDSCLFGAWITLPKNAKTVLDIGAGTGLLSLMTAQKNKTTTIHAIEMDENANNQCKENFEISTWKDRLRIFLGDVRSFPFEQKYDFIISNPPFYEQEKKSKTHSENMAKHSEYLTLSELLDVINKLLSPTGQFAILLPYYRKVEVENLAAQFGYFAIDTFSIRQSDAHSFFRFAAIFSKQKSTVHNLEISIKNKQQEYTVDAIHLLQPYYLFL